MKPTYEVVTTPTGATVINAWYEDGRMLSIPSDPSNPYYQAYLKRDEAEQSTPMIPGDD
jgi:hypothetical protein